jgi:hypothetical protein
MAYESYNAFQSVNSGTNKELFRDSLQQLVNFQFESAPNYEVIKKLDNTTGLFVDIGVRLVQAFEVDGKDIISTDDNVTIEFQDLEQEDIYIGDIYEFKGYRWIAVETKTVATLAKSCRVQRCNGVLKFVEGTPLTSDIIEVDAFMSNRIKDPTSGQYISLPQGELFAKVPYNSNTQKITYTTQGGTRFLFGNPIQAWQVVHIDSITHLQLDTDGNYNGSLLLRLKQVGIDKARDNLVDRVAWQLWFR